MRVRLNLGVGRNGQSNGVEPWLRRFSQQHGSVDTSHTGSAGTGAGGLLGRDLAWGKANLIDCSRLHHACQRHEQHRRHSCRHVPLPATACYFDRKFTIDSVVGLGFSSMIQWPDPGTIPIVTFTATKRRSSASPAPNDFSPPRAKTGIASLPPWASSAWLSMAS